LSIPDPGSQIADPGSQIPDPTRSKNSTKREGSTNFFVLPFFCSHKHHKIENYLIFEMVIKKIGANSLRIIELFIQKIVIKLSKI
jgi:hypothetical protein